MSGVARIMLARGVEVTGTDAKDVPVLKALASEGATVWVGFDPEHQAGADAVVMSSSIRPDNVELVAARDRGVPVLHRAQGLAALMVGQRAVAVAGANGKTTTTSLLTVALQGCGARPVVRRRGRARQARDQRPPGHRRRLRRRGRRERRLLRRLPPRGRHRHERAAGSPRLLRQLQGCPGGLRRLRAHDPARRAARDVRRRPRGRRARRGKRRGHGTRVVTYGFDPGADVVLTEHRQDGLTSAADLRDGTGRVPRPRGAGPAQRAQRCRRLRGGRPRPRPGPGTGARRSRVLHRHPTPLRAQGHRRRRRCRRRLRPQRRQGDRGRRDRRQPRRGQRPTRRRLPAAPLQPHQGLRGRARSRPRPGRRRHRHGRLRGAGGPPPRSVRRARGAGRPRRADPRPRSHYVPSWSQVAATVAGLARPGTSC